VSTGGPVGNVCRKPDLLEPPDDGGADREGGLERILHEGGVSTSDRLLGGGGEPMNKVTEIAIDDLLEKLFRETSRPKKTTRGKK